MTYSVFKLFEIAVCSSHFDYFEISTPVMRIRLTIANSLNHHFRRSAHSVYKIYSDFKLFEIADCSAYFDYFEISTPVMRIMLTMANIV